MSTLPVTLRRVNPPTAAIIPRRAPEVSLEDALASWLARRCENTRVAYRGDLVDLAGFLGVPGPVDALRALLEAGQGPANLLVMQYMDYMRRMGKSSGTVNRRLAAVKSLCKLCRLLGVSQVTIEVERHRHQAYRDVSGPSAELVKSYLAGIRRQIDRNPEHAGHRRDLCVLLLMYCNGLRCFEIVGADLEHYDPAGHLHILGKGRDRREWVTLPKQTVNAIEAWLELRGRQPGPLFCAVRANGAIRPGLRRLWREDLHRMTKRRTGHRPHAYRHSAITAALDATGGDVRAVQKFSRHQNVNTVLIYDDARRDLAGKVSALLGNETEED